MSDFYWTGTGMKRKDSAISPPHYQGHPSGVECIQITEHMNFNLGNAVKYVWLCGLKLDAIEDLKKAKWYLEREIALREAVNEERCSYELEWESPDKPLCKHPENNKGICSPEHCPLDKYKGEEQ